MKLPHHLLAALALATAPLFAASPPQPTAAQVAFFESKIRPILVNECYKCHSAESDRVKGGLYLDTRDALLTGGNTGPAIVPGNPDKSLLIEAVRYGNPDLQMPPKDKTLSAQQVADLVAWVKMGAPDPRVPKAGAVAKKSSGSGDHWAFQPVRSVAPPKVADARWSKNPVDAFIYAGLEAKGLKPSAPAERQTLIRRAYFDLIGLPPTPEEVAAFVADASPDAFARLVDKLLASPHYGERWGRHWLDNARYSDTKGEIKKQYEDETFAFGWTYRDYVIRAFNDDKPYDKFIVEQIAADKLPLGTDKSPLAALGFLTLGERFMNNLNDIIDDRIDVVTKSFLGLTVSCARCHDHKFDPIPTADYYSLHGIFASSKEPAERPVIGKPANPAAYREYVTKIEPLKRELAQLEAQVGSRAKGVKPTTKSKLSKTQKKAAQKRVATIESSIASLQMNHPGAPPQAMALVDAPKIADSPIFLRGEAQSKGAVVPRRFLEVLSTGPRQPFRNGSGRLELAQAIASKDNPLTARVMMNRVWLHHFGEGIITTPDDFGTMADPPSHPELLDYLAKQFMDSGWSVKTMHRLIMNSQAYQQSSEANPRYAQIDPNNRLLWRANVRRLEFEALRDSVLAIGGVLDRKMFGPPVRMDNDANATRRSIYGFIDRSELPEVLNHFDFANPDMTSGKRNSTTVPQQALFFMNSPMVVEQAKKLVGSATFKNLPSDEERLDYLFGKIYQRMPTEVEEHISMSFLHNTPTDRSLIAAKAPSPTPVVAGKTRPKKKAGRGSTPSAFTVRAPLSAWEELSHAMFMANEMMFVN